MPLLLWMNSFFSNLSMTNAPSICIYNNPIVPLHVSIFFLAKVYRFIFIEICSLINKEAPWLHKLLKTVLWSVNLILLALVPKDTQILGPPFSIGTIFSFCSLLKSEQFFASSTTVPEDMPKMLQTPSAKKKKKSHQYFYYFLLCNLLIDNNQ